MPHPQTSPTTHRRKSGSRGNVLTPGPGKRHISERMNCEEINRACDAFFIAHIPGYRIMNIGGVSRRHA